MPVVLAAVLIGIVVWWSGRANELFCVSVRGGRLLLVRGRIPTGLLQGFEDILHQTPLAHGTIRAHRTERGASLTVRGFADEWQEQRLRNVFNTYPISNLRSAPVARNRSLGQVLGVVWLAWLLDRSARRF